MSVLNVNLSDPVSSQVMNRGFLDEPDLFVKQTRKGWFQECLGCDANTEFKIATMADQKKDIYYATEDTSFCIRLICKGSRPFTMTVSEGGSAGGKVHAIYDRPFRCHAQPCKCCCYQELALKSPEGNPLGKVEEDCWYCVPSFKVMSDDTFVQYNIHQPTCCGGMCVDMCAEGCCSCRVPFHIYPIGHHEKGQEVGKITKVWGGLGKEILTDADSFELHFPNGVDQVTKARLLGATFMINQLFFENSGGAPES
jgi:hypothetical protein